MKNLAILTLATLSIFSCSKSDPEPGNLKSDLTLTLEEELLGLSGDPLLWTDDELSFLDDYSNSKLVGLGESTHGTSEFFKAKHRIFRYLVENHGFKIFAIEADYGESIYINQLIQDGNASEIANSMNKNMNFWTWKTTEVKEMLEWMAEYNQGKASDQKLQYIGIDCQFIKQNIDLLESYFERTSASFLESAKSLFTKTKIYYAYDGDNFNQLDKYLNNVTELENLLITMQSNSSDLIASSTPTEYQLMYKALDIVEKAMRFNYSYKFSGGNSIERTVLRDELMAENTIWINEQYPNDKAVVWAHNLHVYNKIYRELETGRMGYHLKNHFGDEYQILGLFFSNGEFRDAYGIQSINETPLEGSINLIMHGADQNNFSVRVKDLGTHQVWEDLFYTRMTNLEIGSVYSGMASNHYDIWIAHEYDRLIYFDNTQHSEYLRP